MSAVIKPYGYPSMVLSRWRHVKISEYHEAWYRHVLYLDSWGGWQLEVSPYVVDWGWHASGTSRHVRVKDVTAAKEAADAWAVSHGFTLTEEDPDPSKRAA